MAIICVDFTGLGVYRTAAERGVMIGSDLSLVAHVGIPEDAHVLPHFPKP